eukprot:4762557-Amphidinium_carterae.2
MEGSGGVCHVRRGGVDSSHRARPEKRLSLVHRLEQEIKSMSMPARRRFVEEKTKQSPTERSVLLGLFTRQGGTGITKSTWQHPLALQLALELGKTWNIPFTSVQINFHQSHAAHKGMQLHQDAFNLPGHCNFTLVMGTFRGGRVWLQEEHGKEDHLQSIWFPCPEEMQ